MIERITAAEYRELAAKPKGNKFHAKKTVVDGIRFDSKRESEVYSDLKILERDGEISGFKRQHEFKLIVNGDFVGKYTADFAFFDHRQDGKFRVWDVKGVQSREFRRARKLVKALYQIDVEVIK